MSRVPRSDSKAFVYPNKTWQLCARCDDWIRTGDLFVNPTEGIKSRHHLRCATPAREEADEDWDIPVRGPDDPIWADELTGFWDPEQVR